jgi:TonB family protein
MGYQALLFCPDEKTARTVTQVLNELEFSVVPCTEPFAAVKKLMTERFDAVVVDCDNEQNATLLFKSARNTADNQSSLAVAVVEGQAGVAKAFRIGANLVLTKPINMEQAKGTLRVARGLLRKGEASKSASAAGSTASKPAPLFPIPTARPSQSAISSPVPAVSKAPAPAFMTAKASGGSTSAPAAKASASLPVEDVLSDDVFEVIENSPATAVPSSAQPSVKNTGLTAAKPETGSVVFGSPISPASAGGAASAPAPAREVPQSVASPAKLATSISKPELPPKGADEISEALSAAVPAPAAFTFGGNVSEIKPSTGHSKKALLGIVASVLIAAAGYAAWTQFERTSLPPASTETAKPVLTSALAPQVTPSAVILSSSNSTGSPITTSAPNVSQSSHPSAASKVTFDRQSLAKADAETASEFGIESEAPKTTASSSTIKATSPKTSLRPITIKSGGTSLAANAGDAVAPSLTSVIPSEGTALPGLMVESNAPTPVLQTMSISQGVSQGLLLKRVQPVYSPNALHLRLEGAVQLMATISKSGDISSVKVLSGEPQLARAAVYAVRQWKYKPYLLNGSPVEIQTQITVNFKLPH